MDFNPKIALVSDIHFGISNFSVSMFEEQMNFFEQQFFPYIIQNEIKNVIFSGDFFHSREKIDWLILDEIKDRFFAWFDSNDVFLHMLVGNHDTYYKDKISQNSLTKTTREYRNIIVYDKQEVKIIEKYTIGFVPWIVDTNKEVFPKKCDILIGHLELKDFPMIKGITGKTGYSHTKFKEYKYVFSGHYHINFQRDNVIMIGTPYQLTWNDFNTQKGFYVLDDNFGKRFIENNTNPKFIKIWYDNGDLTVDGLSESKPISKEESLDIAKHNYVRIYVKKSDNPLALETYQASISSISCNDYKISVVQTQDVVEDFDSSSFDEKFIEEESTLELIIACIQGMTFEPGIDKTLLVDCAIEEYKNANDEAFNMEDE
jgi:DNA repair exonuclease SbcCD nuclease subunit